MTLFNVMVFGGVGLLLILKLALLALAVVLVARSLALQVPQRRLARIPVPARPAVPTRRR